MAEGLISHIGRHVGGLANPPADPTPTAGYRSHWGFWFGGMAVDASTPPVTEESTGGGFIPQAGYQRGERKRRGLERRKRRSDAERIAEMQRAYARLTGEEPAPAVVQAVAAAVRPHVATASDTRLPPVEAIDWRGMLDDLAAIAVLLQLYQRAIDEDDEITLLLLSS